MLAKAIIALANIFNYDRKHIYSTGVIYDRHLRSSKYVYNTGHWYWWHDAKTVQYLEIIIQNMITVVALSSICNTNNTRQHNLFWTQKDKNINILLYFYGTACFENVNNC